MCFEYYINNEILNEWDNWNCVVTWINKITIDAATGAGAAKAITSGNASDAKSDEDAAQIEYDEALAACPPTKPLTGESVIHVQFLK